jgi:hypothetical protein
MANEMKKTFWLVWSPAGFPPKFKHENYWSAENEARRLAIESGERQFVVLEAKCAFQISHVLRTDFSPDADIPF